MNPHTKKKSDDSILNDLEKMSDAEASTDSQKTSSTEAFSSNLSPSSNQKLDLSTVENRYTVLKTLGTGGMGMVQLVQDSHLGRQVALKTIKNRNFGGKSTSRQQVMVWRLKREAEITAILEHPNIIPLYDMQKEKEGDIYFTMRKVEGENFADILKKKRLGTSLLDQDDLLTIFNKICDAVAYAHSKQIIHRDLKPDNVMIGPFGEVYVLDWGIAKHILEDSVEIAPIDPKRLEGIQEARTQVDTVSPNKNEIFQTIGGMGTQGYMAPEQSINASQVREQADIYALGKILKQCFVYLSPLEEFDEKLKIHQLSLTSSKSTEVEQTLSSKALHPEIPDDISAIIQKATDEDWKKRYASVKALAADVERYRKNLQISARQYLWSEIVWKWLQRNKIKVIVRSFFLAILVICFLGFYFYQEHQQQQQRLKEHQKRLNFWKNALQKPRQGMREEALLEISKMNEPEIFEALIKIVQEGTDYFLKSPKRSAKQNEYYGTMVTALGFLGNPKAGEILWKHLEELAQTVLRFEENQQPTADIEYMIALAEAIKNSKAPKYSEKMQGLLLPFSENSLFRTRTQEVLKNLFLIDNLTTTLYPTTTQEYLHRASIKETISDFQGAFEDYEEAVRLDPQNTEILKRRGMIKYKQADLKGALADYSEAIRLNPQNAEAYNSRGITKNDQGDLDGAIADYISAIQIYPQFYEAYNNRGVSKEKKGNTSGAIEDYSEAIRLNPQYTEAYTNRGHSKEAQGDLRGALEDHTQAILLNPKNPFSYNNRGVIKENQGDIDGAIEDYTQAIRLNPQYAEAYTNRGNLKFQKEDIAGALEDYTEAIASNPHFYEAYSNRGTLKERINDVDGAIADYNEAIHLNPQYAEAYCNRGGAKISQLQLEEGLRDLTLADQWSQGALREKILLICIHFETLSADHDIDMALRLFQKRQEFNATAHCSQELADALFHRITLFYRKKAYTEAKTDLDHFERYASPDHPKYPQIPQLRESLEKIKPR
ncbi:MAG: tetratricopeptide repeat protein [Planctomycetota bacterium]